MILQNIWGLLLLLSIPVLILIYIIKQEHKERAVSSTYLWHLSERFLKKRLPIKRLTALLTFLLQLSILSLLAFSAAQPAVALGRTSSHIVVIDASASMQTEQDGVTRFEAAVEEVRKLAQSGLCSSMTVIIASDTPSCPVLGGSASEALNALDGVACGFGSCDLYETMKLVRDAYACMGSAKVTFYTDTEYADVENVEIVDMRRGEKNVAIAGLTHTSGKFAGTLVSYGEDREVTVGLYVDETLVDIRTVSCTNEDPVTVTFESDTTAFKEATLRFDIEDALLLDNCYSIMGKRSETVSVLVTGEETLFFETGFKALGNCEVTVKDQYQEGDDGAYDLYIFSGNIPETDTFPKKGMTIGFAQTSYTVNDRFRNVTLLGNMNVYASFLYKKGLQAIHNQSLEVDPLLVGLEGALEDVYIRSMLACEELRGYYYSISYTPPVGFDWVPICELMEEKRAAACGRVLNNGNRQYLFMFPISETNLAMTPAFMMLLENACKLSSPPSIPQTCYAVGESVEITLKQNAQSPIVTSSDGTVTELNRINTTFIPTAPGVYTLTYDYNNQTREASFFVHISVEEYETYSADTIYLSKTFERNTEGETLFNTMLPSVAVILSALLIFEWGYHYRGKY